MTDLRNLMDWFWDLPVSWQEALLLTLVWFGGGAHDALIVAAVGLLLSIRRHAEQGTPQPQEAHVRE